MNEKPDWDAIQHEYEQGGMPYHELAAKYGVPQTTLYRRSRKWNGTERNTEKRGTERNAEQLPTGSLRILRSELPSPPSAIKGANLGLVALVEHLEANARLMDLADHVKAANALSQYNRIIINAPPESEDEEQEDFSGFTDDELRLYAELQERAKRRT